MISAAGAETPRPGELLPPTPRLSDRGAASMPRGSAALPRGIEAAPRSERRGVGGSNSPGRGVSAPAAEIMRRSVSLSVFLVLAVTALAQRPFRGGRGGYGGWSSEDPAGGTWSEGGWIGPEVKTPRDVQSHSTGTPNWTNPRGFELDT